MKRFVSLAFVPIVALAQRNVEIQRSVDITGPVIRVNTHIVATEVEGTYLVSVPVDAVEKLAFMEVVDKRTDNTLPYSRVQDQSGLANYEVRTSGKDIELDVYSVFTNILKPLPAEITQTQAQWLQYFGSHYVPTMYPTGTQTSTIKLGTTGIQSYTKLPPNALTGTSLVLGPYVDVRGGSNSLSSLTIHYENNTPFVEAAEVIREVEVSHWGNVAFEEFFEVHHAGAKLKGGFSRFDFMMTAAPTALRGFTATLPAGAKDIYYRDQIGNISTSAIRYVPGAVELRIEPRFPLFGGWKTQFYQGYNVPIQELLTVARGTRFTLTVPFSIPYSEMYVEDLTVKVVLPEWASNIGVNIPFEVKQSRTSRLTYLDTSLSGGRPVIILKKNNVVAEHNQPLTVSYDFNRSAMLLEPLYLVGAFLAFYIICMLAVRVDLRINVSIDKEKKTL